MSHPAGNGEAAAALREHDAVADALVEIPPDGTEPVVHLVPDPNGAPMLHRAVAIEAAGRLGALAWHEPADDLRVAGLNRSETDFLHREIFLDNAYFRHGIVLPGDAVVVDAGANIGMFTLYAARHRPATRFVAIEPVAELAAAVAVNAELYGLDVTVVESGLGSAVGEMDFTFYPRNSVMSGAHADAEEDLRSLHSYLLTGAGDDNGDGLDRLATDRLAVEHRRIPVTTLAEVAAEHGLDRIDLLKIDVEKAEAEVLEGIDSTLWEGIRQIVMEVHDTGGRLASVVASLERKGFTVSHEQDPRLTGTPCVNVFARRPDGPTRMTPARATATGPTLRRLEAELRDLLARRVPGLAPPRRFVLACGLDGIAARSTTVAHGAVPHTARTDVFTRLWAGIFGPEAVRPDADFFDLGGDSLTAMRLLVQLEEELGEDALEPDMIFTASTFAELAAAVQASGHDPSLADRPV
ncbi:FkbM family methyltransferase [Streptomyces caelestis]|jgi:FkbM family methyltransferase|uniref:FkbM family methyltransferase n=1 Tax=Streptomyces caelestis TaxID=36816 RepID=UPI0036FC86F3